MEGTGKKAEDTDLCPYCKEGILSVEPRSNNVSCPVCGAYYERGILYRISPLTIRASTLNYRQRKWQQKTRLVNAAERNLAFALSELERVSEENGLSRNAREYAAEVYRKAVLNNLVRGRSTDSIIATAVYAACRAQGIPRSLDEVSESSGISRKELGRTYRFISKGLKLELEPANPRNYIQRYCLALGLSMKVQDNANNLLETAIQRELLSGLGPKGVAAGLVYISAHQLGEHRSQSEVSGISDISEVTLRSRYKKMANDLGIVLEF